MSLNFLGLGASIGVKDLGASKVATGLASAFGGVGTALTSIGTHAAGAVTGLSALAALGGGKLMHLGDAIAGIGTAGQHLTTDFEHAAQQHSVSTRRMIAQTGIFGAELNKLNGQAAGMAHGMGMSDQVAAHAVATFSQFKDEMKALGIESAVTAGKVEEGMGVSIRDVAFQMHRLKDGLKLSQKDMEELGKSFTSTGETIHDIGAPFKSMDAVLDLATRRTNLVRQGLSTIGGKESVKSINRATQSLYILTGDAKGAQEAALGLEDKLASSMENFRNMFTGNSNDLDAFLTNTSVVTGDVQKAFAAAADGPDAFIQQFGGVVAKLKKDGKSTEEVLKFFGGQMSEALGPELANRLVLAVSNADDAKMKMIAGNKAMGKSLGDMGKDAWRSTKTLQDAFDMTMGAGFSRFRKIGIKSAQDFVKETGKSFGEFNAKAEALVKEGGPLGKLVEKMSEVSSLGAKALLPKALQPMVAIFAQLFGAVAPAIAAFSQLKVVLGGLLGPLALIALVLGGLGFLLMSNKKKTNTWSDALSKSIEQIEKFVKDIGNKVLNFAKNFDWVGFFKMLANGLAKGIKSLTALVTKQGDSITSSMFGGADPNSVMGQIMPIVKGIWTAFKDAFGKINWGELITNLLDALLKTRQKLMDKFNELLDDVLGGEGADWGETGQKLWDGFLVALTYLGKFALQNVSFVGGILFKLFKKAIEVLKNVDWGALLTSIGEKLKDAGPIIKEALITAIPKILEFIDSVNDTIIDGFIAIFHQLPNIVRGLWGFMADALGFLADVIIGVWDGIKEYLMKKFPESAGTIMAVFDTIKTVFLTVVHIMQEGLKGFGELFATIGDGIVKLWDYLFGHSKIPELFQNGITAMTDAINGFLGVFENVGKKITELFGGVVDKVRNLFGGGGKSASAAVEADMTESLKTIQGATDKMKEYVQKALFEGVTEAITKAFAQTFKTIMEGSGTFFKAQAKAFQSFAEGVVSMFRTMWNMVLMDSEASAKATAATIGDALKGLERLQVALAQVKAAKAEAAAGEKGEDGHVVRKATEAQALLLETINKPDWYQDYKGDFQQGMSSIVTAIGALRGAFTVPGNSGAAAGQIEKNKVRPTIPFATAQNGVTPFGGGGR